MEYVPSNVNPIHGVFGVDIWRNHGSGENLTCREVQLKTDRYKESYKTSNHDQTCILTRLAKLYRIDLPAYHRWTTRIFGRQSTDVETKGINPRTTRLVFLYVLEENRCNDRLSLCRSILFDFVSVDYFSFHISSIKTFAEV